MIQRIRGGNVYGLSMMVIGLLILAPLLVLPGYPEEAEYAPGFLLPALGSVALGLLVCLCGKRRPDREESRWQSPLQRGSLPVLFTWGYGILAGSLPFALNEQCDFLIALFESVSGWTTTGLSVLDVTKTPHIFLFHKSFMQYCGGLGFIMMMLILVQGKQAMNLYSAEGHMDRLMPNLKKTVWTICLLYVGFFIGGVLLYRIFGMPLFDAFCHAMGALATAGFSTQKNSIGQFDSHGIEVVTMLLMLIGSTNFAALLMLTRFKVRRELRVTELRFLGVMLCLFVPPLAVVLSRSYGFTMFAGLHHALFGAISLFSTTGFSTMNYVLWPAFAQGLMLLFMVIGGGSGSTSGGIKLQRAYLLLRAAAENMRGRLRPAATVTSAYYYRAQGKTPIDATLIADTLAFVICFVVINAVGTLLLTLTAGCTLAQAMFEFTSVFTTAGVTNGLTSVQSSAGTLIVEMAGMILGRLEIFIVFIGAYSGVANLKTGVAEARRHF